MDYLLPSDTLPGQDSNLNYQDQNLVCYRLHHRVIIGLTSRDRSDTRKDEPLSLASRPTHSWEDRGNGLLAEARTLRREEERPPAIALLCRSLACPTGYELV